MNILLFDLESSPNIGYCWGKWDQNIIEFIREKQIISFAWKWLGEKEVKCLSLPMFKGYKKDPNNNKELVTELHKLISRASIVIAHNVDNFDDKMSNTDFIRHGFTPPPPHKTVDTLKVARKKFAFNSNKLDDLGSLLGLGRKLQTGGFSLWKGCLEGDPDSWDLMMKYNKQDVVLLEKVYLKLRPWIENHPNVHAFDAGDGCPNCGEGTLKKEGFNITKMGKRHQLSCNKCGAWPPGKLAKVGE